MLQALVDDIVMPLLAQFLYSIAEFCCNTLLLVCLFSIPLFIILYVFDNWTLLVMTLLLLQSGVPQGSVLGPKQFCLLYTSPSPRD